MRTNPLTLGLLAALTAPTSAYIRFNCDNNIVEERADPIVNAGGTAGHVHKIVGGNGFDLTMDYAKARASTCSTCPIKQDLSNYWTPKLYYKSKEGKFTAVPTPGNKPDGPNGGMTIYYQQRGPDVKALKAFPPDFRMLAGNPSLRSFTGGFAADAVRFACLGTNNPETNNMPNYQCPGGLRAQIYFPSCWDGKNLDSPDHRSHMSYPKSGNFDNGPCPDSHPVQLVSLFFEVLYDTAQFKDMWYGDSHPFVFSNGDPTGYGFHGDFVNGWDINVLQQVIDTCNNNAAFGSIDKKDCAPIDKYTGDEMNACKQSYKGHFTEQVYGPLDALPGNNPVSTGPGPVNNPPAQAPVQQGAGGGTPAGNTGGSPAGGSTSAQGSPTAASSSSGSGYDSGSGGSAGSGSSGSTGSGSGGSYDSGSSGSGSSGSGSSGSSGSGSSGSSGSTGSGQGSGSSSSGSGSSGYDSGAGSGSGSSGGSSGSSGSGSSGSGSSGGSSGSSGSPSGSGSSGSGSSSGSAPPAQSSAASFSPGGSASSSGSKSPTNIDGWKYFGCGPDDHVRTIDDDNTIYTPVGSKMTVAYCANYCKDYKYFGLEAGDQCFCGNEIPADRLPTKDESKCNAPCKADSSQICGGSWRLSLYEATSGKSSAGPESPVAKAASNPPASSVASPTKPSPTAPVAACYPVQPVTTAASSSSGYEYNPKLKRSSIQERRILMNSNLREELSY